jgi:ferredoxin-nitrite reductase
MLRVKIPGGRLTAAQARLIGEIADEHARGPEPHPLWGDGYLDLTTRQDIQLHWIKIGAVPEIWRRLEEVGITTVQACGDSARNVLCCPVSGIDSEEVIDAYPIAVAISDFFTGNREYANLPRKFKMSVTGCREDCAQAEINDLALVPARLDDGTVGFNLLVGGGLSDGPRLASDIDVFVHPNDAVEISRAVAQLFDELGNRDNRWTCRLRYLVQELGPETFRAELAARARIPLTPAGEHLTNRYRGDHIGIHSQRQKGLSYVGVNVTVGRMTGTDLVEMARLAETFGDGEIRLTTDQNLILTGVPEEKIAGLLAEPLLQTHSPNPKPFERGAVACTGNEFCRLAIVETKARALQWAQELDRRVAIEGADIIRLHFSGCSASCAQPQIADIGFRGETAKTADAIVEGVDIGLGGSLGRDAAFIDWVEGAKPVTEVPEAMVRLFDRYAAERREGERFYEWARRMPNDGLRNALTPLPPSLIAMGEGGRTTGGARATDLPEVV